MTGPTIRPRRLRSIAAVRRLVAQRPTSRHRAIWCCRCSSRTVWTSPNPSLDARRRAARSIRCTTAAEGGRCRRRWADAVRRTACPGQGRAGIRCRQRRRNPEPCAGRCCYDFGSDTVLMADTCLDGFTDHGLRRRRRSGAAWTTTPPCLGTRRWRWRKAQLGAHARSPAG